MGIKLIGFGPIGYVRSKMNIFDGIIVIISLVEIVIS